MTMEEEAHLDPLVMLGLGVYATRWGLRHLRRSSRPRLQGGPLNSCGRL